MPEASGWAERKNLEGGMTTQVRIQMIFSRLHRFPLFVIIDSETSVKEKPETAQDL